MSDQKGTSSDPWLGPPPKLQRQTPQRAEHTETLKASFSWLPIALALGSQLLCLFLVIGYRVYNAQVIEKAREQKNFTTYVENLTQQLMSCRAQNRCHPETSQDMLLDKGEKCPVRWSHRINRSYLFSLEKVTWEECKSSCISRSARLLMTDSAKELDFIKQESYAYYEDHGGLPQYYPFWIGLYYDPRHRRWIWVDGTALSSTVFSLPDPKDQRKICAYVQGGTASTGTCGETRLCICEKAEKPSEEAHLITP